MKCPKCKHQISEEHIEEYLDDLVLAELVQQVKSSTAKTKKMLDESDAEVKSILEEIERLRTSEEQQNKNLDMQALKLSEKAFKYMMDVQVNPPEPNEYLKQVATRHKKEKYHTSIDDDVTELITELNSRLGTSIDDTEKTHQQVKTILENLLTRKKDET